MKQTFLVNKRGFLQLEQKIAMVMMIVGLIMLFLIPTWQTPDEYTHLKLIGSSIKNEEFAEILAEDVGIEGSRIMTHYEEKVDAKELKEALISAPKYEKSEVLPKGVSVSIVKHLPATLGIILGIIAGLPTYWVLQLGEIFALLFYVFMGYFALKMMPLKKEVFTIILLMPMALQQAGGIGYDSVLIPLCFFWVAYVLHLRFKEEIQLKDFLCLIALWILITYIKMPYCFLILLILILPLEKIHFEIGKSIINRDWIIKYRWLMIIMGLFFATVGVYLLKDNFWVQLVIGLIKEWRQTIYLLMQTMKTWGLSLITSSVGNFGWLDTPISVWVALLVYVVISLFAVVNSDEKDGNNLRKRERIVLCGTWVILCLFTAFAMVNHTIMVILYGSELVEETYDIQTALYQIPYIGGLQGRYFLPYIILLFLAIPQKKQVRKRKVWFAVAIFEIVMLIYIIYVLLCRYWIA